MTKGVIILIGSIIASIVAGVFLSMSVKEFGILIVSMFLGGLVGEICFGDRKSTFFLIEFLLLSQLIGKWIGVVSPLKVPPLLPAGGILLIFLLWSFWKLAGDEMGVEEEFGKYVDVKFSGWYLRPRGLYRFRKYSTRRFDLFYTVEVAVKPVEVVVKPATEKIEEKSIVPEVKMKINARVNFPREKRYEDELPEDIRDEELEEEKETGKKRERTHPLIKIAKNDIPADEKGLWEYLEGVIGSIVRNMAGKLDYYILYTQKEDVEKELRALMTDRNGELIRMGFSPKGLNILIPEIDVPEELKKALLKKEVEKRESEAAEFESKERAEVTGSALARALGITPEELGKDSTLKEKTVDLLEKEMILKRDPQGVRQLQIKVDGASGIEKGILDMIAALKGLQVPAIKEEKSKKDKLFHPPD